MYIFNFLLQVVMCLEPFELLVQQHSYQCMRGETCLVGRPSLTYGNGKDLALMVTREVLIMNQKSRMGSNTNNWWGDFEEPIVVKVPFSVAHVDECLLKLGKIFEDICNKGNVTCQELESDWFEQL